MTAESEPRHNRTILLVEDDPDFRYLVGIILGASSPANGGELELLMADTGEQALELLRERSPDLVILDLVLPDMHGWEVFMCLRQRAASANIPVIILSCYGTRHDRSFGLQVAHVHDYLTKPCLPSRLRHSVTAALAAMDPALPIAI